MARGSTARLGDEKLTALDRIRQLDEERRTVVQEAKTEAMAKVEEAVRNLNALGFSYRVSQEGRGAPIGSPRRGTRQVNPERPCPICGFLTKPLHDARAHRGQGWEKRPFNAQELHARGYEKV